jgi:hypothetical protein
MNVSDDNFRLLDELHRTGLRERVGVGASAQRLQLVRPVASSSVVTTRTFGGVRLSVPTAFGILATGWPFARISIGEDGVELIAILPRRSEWYSELDDITSVKADAQNVLLGRADGGIARFRFCNRDHDAIIAALVECGLSVEHVESISSMK